MPVELLNVVGPIQHTWTMSLAHLKVPLVQRTIGESTHTRAADFTIVKVTLDGTAIHHFKNTESVFFVVSILAMVAEECIWEVVDAFTVTFLVGVFLACVGHDDDDDE
mmetsp:Transcript_9431/g.35041  ORF Transcript_9431/g.35041 Transcript_9431/m.35041 type:complete len:108 (-) Transcript_9431:36-359(-)